MSINLLVSPDRLSNVDEGLHRCIRQMLNFWKNPKSSHVTRNCSVTIKLVRSNDVKYFTSGWLRLNKQVMLKAGCRALLQCPLTSCQYASVMSFRCGTLPWQPTQNRMPAFLDLNHHRTSSRSAMENATFLTFRWKTKSNFGSWTFDVCSFHGVGCLNGRIIEL